MLNRCSVAFFVALRQNTSNEAIHLETPSCLRVEHARFTPPDTTVNTRFTDPVKRLKKWFN